MDANYINHIIALAIEEMNKNGIIGKDQTPFLLSRIVELTSGESLETNINLIVNNAKLGAQIAQEFVKLK
jgi:pseudouridine-5'-phosphate glycosidase